MPTPIRVGTRAQPASIDEAVPALAVTGREPDRDVPSDELASWLAEQERLEIRAALRARGLL